MYLEFKQSGELDTKVEANEVEGEKLVTWGYKGSHFVFLDERLDQHTRHCGKVVVWRVAREGGGGGGKGRFL